MAGGGVEQTNRNVSVDTATTAAALEMWGYSIGNTTDKIFVFDDTGNIRIEEAPSV